MASTIHASAQSGFSNASSYDAYRPSYPQKSVETLIKSLGIDDLPGARVIDLAAGTGKFTTLLAARKEEFQIIAVEPHADMRSVLEKKAIPRVTVINGTATDMSGVEDGYADAVVIAQAFHWFANMDALREIHKKLIPGGILGLIWNLEDYNSRIDCKPSTKWEAKMKDIIWSHGDLAPRFRHSEWPKVFDEQLGTNAFSGITADPLFSLPLGEDIAKWTVWLTKEAVWERFHTNSHIANLKGQELEDIKRKVFDAMEIDDIEMNEKGEVALHGQTVANWTTAIPSEPLGSRD